MFLKKIFYLGPSGRSVIKPKSENETFSQSGQAEETSSFSKALVLEKKTSKTTKRHRHFAQTDKTTKKAQTDQKTKTFPQKINFPTEHMVYRTLSFSGQAFVPISAFSDSATPTRWDAAASTLLHMSIVFLKNLPDVT